MKNTINQTKEETINTHTNKKSEISNILNININNKQFNIIKKSDSKIEGEKFGLNIKKAIPIFFLKGGSPINGGYHPELDIIIIFEHSKGNTIHHEIIHSIEHSQEKSIQLISFYNKVKKKITEDSFTDGFYSWNFKKNIGEFIADGYSKKSFIIAMKNEGLYKDFLKETKYLFI